VSDRPSARQRGYTPAWDRAASAYKAQHPLCLGCSAVGRAEPTTVVDHIIPHKGDQALFWDQANWQPACAWHHDSIKAQLEHLYATGRATVDDLRLDSPKAQQLSKVTPRKPTAIGADGWPID
jgi:5-methylcytosine-specific restriction protein A